LAAAKALARYGSSPYPSTTRPQRGSLVTSTMGANVQRMPTDDASRAATVASVWATPGSKLLAWASGTGNVVR
jgi:hypothetical protein